MVRQGDIFWVNFNPSQGHEERNFRPAVALSNDLIQKTSRMTIVAPISSTKRQYPMYYKLQETDEITGKVLLDQTTALDLQARQITSKQVVESLSSQELNKILRLYRLMFMTDDDAL